jgi:hypothetical protein
MNFRPGGIAQVVERLCSRHEALNSNPSQPRDKKSFREGDTLLVHVYEKITQISCEALEINSRTNRIG